MIFEDILGDIFKNTVYYLKHECKIDVGFCSQKVGNNKQSAASTAIIIYALKKLRLIDVKEENIYRNELLSFQNLDGTFGTTNGVTTWSTSQACLTLETLGCNEDRLYKAIQWLCKVQNSSGGWNFNGKSDSSIRIEYCLYPLLALKKYPYQNETTTKVLDNGLSYIKTYTGKSTFAKIVRLFLLKKIYGKDTDKSDEYDALRSLRRDILLDSSDHSVKDTDENHFYVDFYLPAYYLLLRVFVKPDNPLSLYLIKVLLDSVITKKGWAPANRSEPHSWTTALALLTIAFWISDCKRYSVDDTYAINKLNSIKKGDITMQAYIEKCPLNGGLCNKTNEIDLDYKGNNIFLDIPYDPEYLTFEDILVKTIRKCGLIPIKAKDTIKSKALLCKICSLIQKCKYGLVDVSSLKHNIPFELGLLLGLSKNCVILKKKDATIPSDISGLEYIEYQNTTELKKKLSQWIKDNK